MTSRYKFRFNPTDVFELRDNGLVEFDREITAKRAGRHELTGFESDLVPQFVGKNNHGWKRISECVTADSLHDGFVACCHLHPHLRKIDILPVFYCRSDDERTTSYVIGVGFDHRAALVEHVTQRALAGVEAGGDDLK